MEFKACFALPADFVYRLHVAISYRFTLRDAHDQLQQKILS